MKMLLTGESFGQAENKNRAGVLYKTPALLRFKQITCFFRNAPSPF